MEYYESSTQLSGHFAEMAIIEFFSPFKLMSTLLSFPPLTIFIISLLYM